MPRLLWSNHRLSNCCFCINLRAGCRTIGSLTMIICSFQLMSAQHTLTELHERERHCRDNVRWEGTQKPYLVNCSYIKAVRYMLIFDFIIFLLGFISSLFLLIGIKYKHPRLFLTWLIFTGMVISSNFFSILIWYDLGNVMSNILIIIILSYFFVVVRSYHLQLYDEVVNGCPVVAVAFPQESGMRVFLPNQSVSSTSNQIKDDPPPPYPGLSHSDTFLASDLQPPPYSFVNLNQDGPGFGHATISEASLQPYSPSNNVNQSVSSPHSSPTDYQQGNASASCSLPSSPMQTNNNVVYSVVASVPSSSATVASSVNHKQESSPPVSASQDFQPSSSSGACSLTTSITPPFSSTANC